MRYQDVVHRVRDALPHELAERAPTMLEGTLAQLLPLLPRHARRSLLSDLPSAPAALSAEPGSGDQADGLSREGLQERVARITGIPRGTAIEVAQLVCGSLRSALEPEVCDEVIRELPAELAQLFAPPPSHGRPDHVPTHGHHLSDGKPGASHPVSESAPGSTHPMGAAHPAGGHSQSVTAENPHGDSKVSSAQGLTQEREHESLSRGRDPR